MKTKPYERTDGTPGTEYKLEDGDIVRILFTQPSTSVVTSKGKSFEKYSLQVTTDLDNPLDQIKEDTKIYLTLTKTQAKQVKDLNLNIGDKIKGEKYKNKFGWNVAVRKA